MYWIRKSILLALVRNQEYLCGNLLDVGCGQSPYKPILLSPQGCADQYVGLDLNDNPVHVNQPDVLWDGRSIPLEDSSFDSVVLTEVLEHCPEPRDLLGEVNRVMKPGAKLFGTVPFIYPLHEAPWDFYRYTPFAIERLAKQTDFKVIKIESLGGWHASLALMIGLWLRQSKPLSKLERVFWTALLYPLYHYLLWRERINITTSDFDNGTLMTGVAILLEKI